MAINSYLQLKCINNNAENSINLRLVSGRDKYAKGVVLENGYYSIEFVIYTAREIIDGEFYIEEEDIGSLQLIQREEERQEFKVIYKGSHERERAYPFLMMIDSVRLRVRLIFDDEFEEDYYSDRVLVTTKSVEEQKNVDDMINYIAGRTGLSRQIDTSYDEDTITLGLFNNNIYNIIKLYEKYRGFYEAGFLASDLFRHKRQGIFLSNFMGLSAMRNKKVEKERLLIMNFLSEVIYSSKRLYKVIGDITKLRNILLRNKYRSDEKFNLDGKIEGFINPIFWMYMTKWKRDRKVNLSYHEIFLR